jgi:hypothetical protein
VSVSVIAQAKALGHGHLFTRNGVKWARTTWMHVQNEKQSNENEIMQTLTLFHAFRRFSDIDKKT